MHRSATSAEKLSVGFVRNQTFIRFSFSKQLHAQIRSAVSKKTIPENANHFVCKPEEAKVTRNLFISYENDEVWTLRARNIVARDKIDFQSLDYIRWILLERD